MSGFSPRTRREINRFLKFSVVGIIGAVVDFGSFNLLANMLGVASIVASVISFSAAVTSNFLWNRYWTYPDSRSKPVSQQVIQFTSVNLVGLVIRTPIFAFSEAPLIQYSENLLPLVQSILPESIASLGFLNAIVLGRNLALALAVIVVLFWNFFINRIWTYSDAE
ncbi:MAG: GtrA family protein [Anaerolineales bacterium]|nr:MAG: GtrA family protein [Anaerolineales bacterium]